MDLTAAGLHGIGVEAGRSRHPGAGHGRRHIEAVVVISKLLCPVSVLVKTQKLFSFVILRFGPPGLPYLRCWLPAQMVTTLQKIAVFFHFLWDSLFVLGLCRLDSD